MAKHKPVRRGSHRELCPVCGETTTFIVVVKPGRATTDPNVREVVRCNSCNSPLVPHLPVVKETESGYVLLVSREARDLLAAFYTLQKLGAGDDDTTQQVADYCASIESAASDVSCQLQESVPDWDDIATVLSGIATEANDAHELAMDRTSLVNKLDEWRDMFMSVALGKGGE